MIGLVVILLISWGLLFLFEKKNLNAIGLVPNGKRLLQIAFGLLLIVLICLILLGIETQVKSIESIQGVSSGCCVVSEIKDIIG